MHLRSNQITNNELQITRAKRAFTLIELLIYMALVSVFLTAAVTSGP